MGRRGGHRPPFGWTVHLAEWSIRHREYLRGRAIAAGHDPASLASWQGEDWLNFALAVNVDGLTQAVDLPRVLAVVEAVLEGREVVVDEEGAVTVDGEPAAETTGPAVETAGGRRIPTDPTTPAGSFPRAGQARPRAPETVPGAEVMPADIAAVLAGDEDGWGESSRARAGHSAMIGLAGGLPPGWEAIAAEAERRAKDR